MDLAFVLPPFRSPPTLRHPFVAGAFLCALYACACQPRPAPTPPVPSPSPTGTLVVERVHFSGDSALKTIVISDGVVASVLPSGEEVAQEFEGAPHIDGGERFVVPGLVDSHVHFNFLAGADGFSRAGFAAAVDLAAPLAFLEESKRLPLTVLNAGPMITSMQGYPTQSWGRDGYGLQVPTAEAASRAAESLIDAGARVLKIPLDGDRGLDDAQAAAVVAVAHARSVKVVAHALSDLGAQRAATAGVDALAHAPGEPLTEETVRAWSEGAVIGTLSAFGNSGADNLRRLREAGATLLYGTDFGNSTTVGVSAREIAFLAGAGLSSGEIVAAMTTTPAEFWGLSSLGTIAEGKEATFLVLDTDPAEDALALTRPRFVIRRGIRLD